MVFKRRFIFTLFLSFFICSQVYASSRYNPRMDEIADSLDRAEYSNSRKVNQAEKQSIKVDQIFDPTPSTPILIDKKSPSKPIINYAPVLPDTDQAALRREIDPEKSSEKVAQPPKADKLAKNTFDEQFDKLSDFSNPDNSLEVAFVTGSYKLEESSRKEADEDMVGIQATYMHRYGSPSSSFKESMKKKMNPNMMAIDIELVGNRRVEYESSQAPYNKWLDGLAKWDVRARLGHEIALNDRQFVRPYVGIGYTRWDDTTYTVYPHLLGTYYPYALHERTFGFWYVPLGFDIVHSLKNNWSVKFNVEYDYSLYGRANTKLTATGLYGADASYNYGPREAEGYRASFQIAKDFGGYALFIEPFFRTWHMERSDRMAWVSGDDEDVGVGDTWIQPFETKEYGAKMGIKF